MLTNSLIEMPTYTISYSTVNTYTHEAIEAVLEFLVLPANESGQELINYNFECKPNVHSYLTSNNFGFELIHYRVKNLQGEFKFSLNAKVEKKEINPFDFTPMPYDEEWLMLNSEDFQVDHYPFLGSSGFTAFTGEWHMPVKGDLEGVFNFAKRVNAFVYDNIAYDNSVVDPMRRLDQTLKEKCGVCQDFAHLMLAIMHKSKVPARYVSGYLNPGDGHKGASAIHAWVEVMVPGVGWKGFDPTNNLLADHHYIKIAHGTDISDCSSLKGVIKGPGQNQTNYMVLVEEQIKDANQ